LTLWPRRRLREARRKRRSRNAPFERSAAFAGAGCQSLPHLHGGIQRRDGRAGAFPARKPLPARALRDLKD
jgi:hypothetical protein